MIVLIIILLACLALSVIFESCSPKACPAYAKNNTEHEKTDKIFGN